MTLSGPLSAAVAHSNTMAESGTGISGAGIRTARAVVFTALCVTLSAGAHVLLSGVPLPLLPLAGISVVVFALAFALAGRERGFWHIAALLIPLELTADTVFTTGQQACYGQSGGPVTDTGRLFGVDLLCTGGAFGTPLARAVAGSDAAPLPADLPPAAPWLLLTVHLGVGLLAAAWLRRGEAALARLLGAAVALTFRPLLLAVAVCRRFPEPATGPARRAPAPRAARTLPLPLHSVPRRGPPCWALAS